MRICVENTRKPTKKKLLGNVAGGLDFVIIERGYRGVKSTWSFRDRGRKILAKERHHGGGVETKTAKVKGFVTRYVHQGAMTGTNRWDVSPQKWKKHDRSLAVKKLP